MHKLRTTLLAFFCLLICSTVVSNAQDSDPCRTAVTPELKVSACTRKIQSDELKDQQLALAHYNRAVAWYQLQRFEDAVADFSKSLEISARPDFKYSAYLFRGVIHDRMGAFEIAVKDFSSAIELMPKNIQAYDARGDSYCFLRRYSLAFSDYNQAIALAPDNPRGYMSRGICYLNQGKRKLALSDARKCQELSKGSGICNGFLEQLGILP
jgi:tetratricopeptide (TPR) repeat protein